MRKPIAITILFLLVTTCSSGQVSNFIEQLENPPLLQPDTFIRVVGQDTIAVVGYEAAGGMFIQRGFIDSVLVWQSTYSNNQPHGHSMLYYKTGRIKSYTNYVHKKVLASFSFAENGQLLYSLVVDTIAGISNRFEFYDSGGIQCKSQTLLNNGEITVETCYYEQGELMYDFKINDGKQPMTVYFPSGAIYQKGSYIDFSLFLVGKFEEYYENGHLAISGNYLDATTRDSANIKDGLWSFFDSNGRLTRTESYSKNTLLQVVNH